jgi:hypothetical protein
MGTSSRVGTGGGRESLDIMAASDVCVGSTLMEYSDEWWKAPGSYGDHDWGGFYVDKYAHSAPDGYANEEWWGIVEIAPDGTWSTPDGIDDVRPRNVYYELALIFEGARVVEPGESIQDAIDAASSGDTIYLADGIFDFEDDISVEDKDNLTILGAGEGETIIEGNISFENSDSSIESLTIYYQEGGYLTYSNAYHTDLKLLKDSGILAVDSEIVVNNCNIEPDPNIFTTNYGKGIQILNLYRSDNISPIIEGNLIQNADAGIYLYSHSSGGAIEGEISNNNTLDSNNCGIVLRMHLENPLIDGNIISNSIKDAIHITYEDGSLLTDRLENISYNTFSGNTRNVFCDELGTEVIPTGEGNIYE